MHWKKNYFCMTIFIDFKKAFDTVDFGILLDRLSKLGIRNKCLSWFESYLRGRSVKVVINNEVSQAYPLNCGVPQGSVLGPLLFLIYVDSMRFFVPGYLTSFADDTAITVIAKSLPDLIDRANSALKGLHTFVTLSKLAVNASKTNYMVFRRTGEPQDLPSDIKYNGVSLKQVRETRYLWVSS